MPKLTVNMVRVLLATYADPAQKILPWYYASTVGVMEEEAAKHACAALVELGCLRQLQKGGFALTRRGRTVAGVMIDESVRIQYEAAERARVILAREKLDGKKA